MAIQPFIRLGVAVAGLTGPTIDPANVRSIFPVPLETDAVDQWVFNTGDSSCLTGRINQNVLTPHGAAPAYSAEYLTIPDYTYSGSGATIPGGLMTSVTDSAHFTIMCAFQEFDTTSTATSSVIMGSMSANSGDGGSAVYKNYVNSSSPNNNVPNARSRPGSNHFLGAKAMDASKWYIACMSADGAGNYTYYIPGLADPLTESVTKTISANKLAFGNAYYLFSGNASKGLKLREGIVWAGINKTPDEMDLIAARMRLRAQDDGITIV